MNEQTMIWFLRKSNRYALSREAVTLWMDFYAYLQHQSRACYPKVAFVQLRDICDLEADVLWRACHELKQAAMLEVCLENGQLFCRLIGERLYKAPHATAG